MAHLKKMSHQVKVSCLFMFWVVFLSLKSFDELLILLTSLRCESILLNFCIMTSHYKQGFKEPELNIALG